METTQDLKVRFRITRTRATVLLVFLFVLWHPGFIGSETLTLTTYYPAPYGGYVSILTTNQTVLARDAGNVGIGTNAPTNKLQVNGTGDTAVDLAVNGRIMTGDGNNDGGVYLSSSKDGFVGNSGGTIGFLTSSGWALQVLKSNGNVGIGTATPARKLDVNGDVNVGTDLYVQGNETLVGAASNLTFSGGYISGLCQSVAYSFGGNQSCPRDSYVVGAYGDGGARYIGFLPTSVTTSGVGNYIVIGEDWGGTMICCRIILNKLLP
jgi:hypothetical protein